MVIYYKVMPSSPNDPNLNLDTLSDLIKLLQEASEREEAINQCAEHWHGAYLDLKQALYLHVAFKYKYLCLDFEQQKKRDQSRSHYLSKECSTVDENPKEFGIETGKRQPRTQLLARVL